MDSKKVAKNIKAERIRAGLKVEQVAQEMGLTKATIYTYEKDAKGIELNKLFKLAEVLKCSIQSFLN